MDDQAADAEDQVVRSDLERLVKTGATPESLEGCVGLGDLVLGALDLQGTMRPGGRGALLHEVLSGVTAEHRQEAFDRREGFTQGSAPKTLCCRVAAAAELLRLTDDVFEAFKEFRVRQIGGTWADLVAKQDKKSPAAVRRLRAALWLWTSSARTAAPDRHQSELLDALEEAIPSYIERNQEHLRIRALSYIRQRELAGVGNAIPAPVVASAPKDQLSHVEDAPTPRQTHRAIDPRLEEILRNLANLVRGDLQSQERWRQDNEPFLSVSYTAAPSHLHDHWDNISNIRGAEPIPLDGTLDRIADTFTSIPSRRLVVLGRAGAGKTTLSTKLALALLDPVRRPPNEVPVVFHLSSWSPEQSLDDWLSSQLIAYPELNEIFQQRAEPAAGLVRRRHVVPILDGFDEIDPSLRTAAIRMLKASRSYGEPLILTSRPEEYVEAIESSGYVDYAPAVTLEDLAADEVARYLPLTALKLKPDEKQAREYENRTKWDPVVAAMREDHQEGSHGATLLEVLSTPLMVFLARKIYSDDSSVDINDLLDPALFPDINAISNHLIDQYVRAAYEQPSHNHASKHESLPPAEAHYRLACYAVFLHSLGVRDWSSFRNEIKKTQSIEVPFPMSRIKFLADDYRENAIRKTVAKRYRGARFRRFKVEFLEDARRRGILQKSGQEYVFRHSLLQDRLAYDALAGPMRRRLGNPKFRSRAMQNLAVVLFRSGRFKEAELLIEEALHLQNNRPFRRDGPFSRRPAEWHIEYGAGKVQWKMDVYKGGSSSGTLVLPPYRRK